jgi:glycosyltransferase involved in cell wall biosynthesis
VHYLAPLTQIPVVYTLHDPAFIPDTLEGWRFARFAKDNYIAISHRQAEIFRQHQVNVIAVVHHGFDTKKIEFSTTSSNYLVFVGRFIQEKGADDALTLAERLKQPLHMATSDNYLRTPYFEKYIKPRLNNPLFTLTGYLDDQKRNIWLKGAKALLFPIHWEEPFGMVLLEAMAAGVPVVAYNRGSVSEIVRDGVTGFMVEPEEGLVNQSTNAPTPPLNKRGQGGVIKEGGWIIKKRGIEGLVEAVKRIGEIDRAACRKHVQENFTVERMVQNYEKVYQKVIQMRGK